jgi:hypothetical protein
MIVRIQHAEVPVTWNVDLIRATGARIVGRIRLVDRPRNDRRANEL